MLAIFDSLDCSLLQVCFLLDIDFLGGGALKTWDYFFDSVNTLNEDERRKILELAEVVIIHKQKKRD